ncbi:gfo/Idh/MocA family oxidoreductase, partial [Streptomyces solisilvae]
MTTAEPLRIGILGAARIAGLSIVGPARVWGERPVAVGGRSPGRGEDLSAKRKMERGPGSPAHLVYQPKVG